jgi:hypothetical protein
MMPLYLFVLTSWMALGAYPGIYGNAMDLSKVTFVALYNCLVIIVFIVDSLNELKKKVYLFFKWWCCLLDWCLIAVRTEFGLLISITLLHLIVMVVLVTLILNLIDSLLPWIHPILYLLRLYNYLIIVVSSYISLTVVLASIQLGVRNYFILFTIFILMFISSYIRLPYIGFWLAASYLKNLL